MRDQNRRKIEEKIPAFITIALNPVLSKLLCGRVYCEACVHMKEQAAGGSFLSHPKESIHDSAGEIIFGMSDVVVSIFGLVLGVAAGEPGRQMSFSLQRSSR
jgi:hypothetical protein